MNNEYELFPHRLFEDIKKEVEALKKKLSQPDLAIQELIAELEEFRSDLKELRNIFQETLSEVKEEDSTKLLLSLQNKIETITTQNETIARGMVAISDKLEDFMKEYKSLPSKTPPLYQKIAPPPSFSRPIPSLPSFSPGRNLPPPPPPVPPPKTKRSGLFK